MICIDSAQVWDQVYEYVECGLLARQVEENMTLAEAYYFVHDESNKRDLECYKKHGMTEEELKFEMRRESYRW